MVALLSSQTLEIKRLKRLCFARLFGTSILLLILSSLHGLFNVEHPDTFENVYILWFALSALQFLLFRFPNIIKGNLLFQLTSDLLLISLLVFDSGGISSPLIFLFGLTIIIAGTQARVLIVLITAILASTTYLGTIYTYAFSQQLIISNTHTLNILLQISLFFLTGGIMALIAGRHAKLQLDKQQTTSQHRQLQELHSQVLRSMQESIIILDNNMIVQDFNHAAITMLNISEQHKGYSLEVILNLPTSMKNVIHSDSHHIFRTELQHDDKFLLLTLTRLLDESSAWLLTIVDITETRKLEKQLSEQDKLASIGQMAAMLAHEIRNPMQTITQAVELMGLTQKENKLENLVTDEIRRLNRLVSNMLDYASPLHPNILHCHINTLIQSSLQQVDLKNIHRVQVDAPDISINIDPDHFRLVLDNLLRNAIHMSPEATSVAISFQSKLGSWSLTVRDHGIGISEEIRHSLFEPFRTGRKQGTGLGLATVWQVCQINSWVIRIDENIHDGACFIIQNQPPDTGETHG